MTASGVLIHSGDQPHLVDEIVTVLRSEIKQGFDQVSVKLIEDIKMLLSNADISLLTTSSSTLVRQMSSGQLELRPASSKTSNYMSTISENASELLQLYSAGGENILDVTGNDETGPKKATHVHPHHVTIPDAPESDISLPSSKDTAQNVKTMITGIMTAQATSEAEKKDRLHWLIRDSSFSRFCMLVIFINAIWTGYESDYPEDSKSGWRLWVGNSFNIWFILELLLKVVCLRRDFIVGPDRYWNIVDAFCVLSSIPDLFSSSLDLSFFRIVRLSRLTRSLRVVRIFGALRSLREILLTVFHTMGSLFWCFVAIVFVAYIFALVLLQLLTISGESFSPDTMHNFKDVLSAMTTLFSFISGGMEWHPFAQDFHEHGAYLAETALLFYIFFMLFGLLNVVIAVFCAQVDEACHVQSDLRIEKNKEKTAENLKEWMAMFNIIDTESKGYLTWQQFRRFGYDKNGEHLFQSHGLSSFALEDMWGVMEGYTEAAGETEASGAVDMTGFIMGFMRLSTDVYSSNLMLLSRSIERLHVDSKDMARKLQDDMKLVRQLHQLLFRKPAGKNLPLSTVEHLGRQEPPLRIGEPHRREESPQRATVFQL